MDKKIKEIEKLPPDFIERELGYFLKDARGYLFKKKKTMIDFLIITPWICLTLAIIFRAINGGW